VGDGRGWGVQERRDDGVRRILVRQPMYERAVSNTSIHFPVLYSDHVEI
jgi:hypothetical protein